MDKVICVGKNYLEHAKELGDVIPEKPVLFLKPPSTIEFVANHQTLAVELVQNRGAVHHEAEIVVRLDQNLKIDAVTLGLDMTLRDSQTQLKKNGHPWEISKVFLNSTILGPWILIKDFPNYLDEEFSFILNGQTKQKSKGKHMRLSPQECLDYAAEYFPLVPGDIIFTGTPEGVGPVSINDQAQLQWGSINYSVKWV